MQLKIRDKFFQLIKDGKKRFDFREAHITFINEDTGEQMRKEIKETDVLDKDSELVKRLSYTTAEEREELFKDKRLVYFALE